MKISLNWLKDFVDIDVTLKELADKLVSAGLEVEEIVDQSADMKNVVLGKILSLTKHPDADKLQICQIDIGTGEPVQIVTGAQNVSVGDFVPTALDHSLLPNGQEIKKGKLRGVASDGMLCSGEELNLTKNDYHGADAHGILLMNGETAPVGTDLNVVLGRDDVILDIGVTANRGDCNSVLGIAREVSAILKKPLRMPDLSYTETGAHNVNDIVSVEVRDTDLCPRYLAAAVENVKIGESAPLIRKRLKAVGLRPINNIVDITNYVLIEIGQPMHAFDGDQINGKKIIVRHAADEKIVALDDKEYTLDKSMLAVCDANAPSAVAGVMGGAGSGVSEDTHTVVFEAAKFMRDNIRRTARTLNLHSDSSFRFERGIDFESQTIGMRRALHLISQYGYGEISQGLIDCLNADLSGKTIQTTTDKIDDILGIRVPREEMTQILNRLQIETTLDGNVLTCKQPPFRDDIENANDLAEEIIRLYGYDHIECTLMDRGRQTIGGKTQAQKNLDTIKEIALNRGMHEILTYSFSTPKMFDALLLSQDDPLRKCVKLRNPLGEDLSIMRTTLAYAMIQALANNYLKNIKSARFFEAANVYIPKSLPLSEQPDEIGKVALGAYGEEEDFYRMKGIVELIGAKFGLNLSYRRADIPYLHSGRGAYVVCGKETIGYVGEVHPSVANAMDVKCRMYLAELDVDAINRLADTRYRYEAIAKYPPMERDIAVIVSEDVSAAQLLNAVRKGGGNLLKECGIFDIYRSDAIGASHKSVAINLVFRNVERTLTEEEVNAKVNRILTKLSEELGASLRE